MPKGKGYPKKKPITVRKGESLMSALKRSGSIPQSTIQVDRKTKSNFAAGNKKPTFDTITRIARATKTGGKSKPLTKKDYKRAQKQVSKLKKKNKKVAKKKNKRRKFLGLFK